MSYNNHEETFGHDHPSSSNQYDDPSNQYGEPKDYIVALLLSCLVGGLAVDRFYLGYIGLGILKLFTLGGLGVWVIIDIFLIATRKLQPANGYYTNSPAS